MPVVNMSICSAVDSKYVSLILIRVILALHCSNEFLKKQIFPCRNGNNYEMSLTRQAFCLKTFTSHTAPVSLAISLMIKLASQSVLEASFISKCLLHRRKGCDTLWCHRWRVPHRYLDAHDAQRLYHVGVHAPFLQ